MKKTFVILFLLYSFSCSDNSIKICENDDIILKTCYWKYNRIKIQESPPLYIFNQCNCPNDTLELKTIRKLKDIIATTKNSECIETTDGKIYEVCNLPECLKKVPTRILFDADEKEPLKNTHFACWPIELTKIKILN